jgi:hypothetical protein
MPFKTFLTAALATLTLMSPVIEARQVLGKVKQLTQLDEKIARACHDHCQGNRRQGRLTSVDVTPTRNPRFYKVDMTAAFKNHHHVKTFLGGGFAAYEFTVHIRAQGTLDINRCTIHVDRAWVENDRLGLSRYVRGEVGKTHSVPNCHKFI